MTTPPQEKFENLCAWIAAIACMTFCVFELWLVIAGSDEAVPPRLGPVQVRRVPAAETNVDLGELDSPGQYAATHGNVAKKDGAP